MTLVGEGVLFLRVWKVRFMEDFSDKITCVKCAVPGGPFLAVHFCGPLLAVQLLGQLLWYCTSPPRPGESWVVLTFIDGLFLGGLTVGEPQQPAL